MESGEKSTKYFFKRESLNGVKKEIDCIEDNGATIFGKDNILKAITKYFSQLYSRSIPDDIINMKTYLKTTKLNVLNEKDSLCCEGPLSEN